MNTHQRRLLKHLRHQRTKHQPIIKRIEWNTTAALEYVKLISVNEIPAEELKKGNYIFLQLKVDELKW